VTGGGWTEIIPGKYHQHQGFWCNDPNALASFRSFARERHGTLPALRNAWGVDAGTWEEVDFPARGPEVEKTKAHVFDGTAQERRYWLDFVEWYRAEMTRWSDSWIETTRRHFPDTPIYLCTGGDAIPEHGSNFAEQCRVAAKYNAGVRITNESSNYAANFSITRWVAAAGRHYNAYFGFEPAGAEDEVGIVARIYNATASGANQLHDYNPNVMTSATRLEAQRKHLPYLFRTKPIVPVALWYPETHLALKWGSYLEKAQKLRDYTDFDYLDESMLDTGALDHYKVLLILHGAVLETSDAQRIAEWVKNGGRLLVNDVPSFEAVDHSNGPEESLFGVSPLGRGLGTGRVSRTADWDSLASALKEMLTETGQVACDLKPDQVYCTQLAPDRFLILNTTSQQCGVQFTTGADTKEYKAEPGTISDATIKIVYAKGDGENASSQ
jgi:hypothetical protein